MSLRLSVAVLVHCCVGAHVDSRRRDCKTEHVYGGAAALAVYLNEQELDATTQHILGKLQAHPANTEIARTYMQSVGALRYAGVGPVMLNSQCMHTCSQPCFRWLFACSAVELWVIALASIW